MGDGDAGAGENEAGFAQSESLKGPAECPKLRRHRVLRSRPAEIAVVLTMSAGLKTRDMTCTSQSAVQVRLRANSLGATGRTTFKFGV